MHYTIENSILTLFLQGRIDSGSAPAAEAEIQEIRSQNPGVPVILDAEKLDYISSAGLRVILRLRKSDPALKIVNVSSDVYEIFDMTGFTEMIPVEKAYRRFSVDGCEVIGQGANGMVYRIDGDTIIKVYRNPDSLPDIQRERELARKAFVLGIPTAIPYDVVKVGESYGSVFELLNAKSFAKLIQTEPQNLDKYTSLYVDLLKKIHSTEVKPEDMPDMKAVAVNWVTFLEPYLPEADYAKLLRLVKAVPESHHMLHGDYHLKNVMMQNGEVLLIDMDTLCQGDPIFEFASVYLAYQGYCALDHSIIQDFMGIDYDTAARIWNKTLQLYFETEDKDILSAAADKSMLMGLVRMMRRSIRRNGLNTDDGRSLINYCKENIHSLLGRVETLQF